MEMNDIILKKRLGNILNKDEITYFINGYTKGEIPDYQASALLMAIMFQKLTIEETVYLTEAMKQSGDTVDLSKINGIKVDKHSTGGVGDKTTLIVGPIAAACGVPVAKMSGRGLGFTGGTVDKMESIPGMRTTMEPDEFIDQVNRIGLAVIGQTGHIAPADKKLYALRDVTATIDNLSLIASSIMSKKLAAGADAIVLDVKCGNGAFMKNIDDATDLADMMVRIGHRFNKKTVAVITDMNQPLGQAVGNSLEVIEAIQTLKNKGPEDITELSLLLAGIMIYLGQKSSTLEEGQQMAAKAIRDGSALEKLRRFILAQSGDPRVVDDEYLFPQPKQILEVKAHCDGFIRAIDANRIGLASQHTGAGRMVMGESIDLSAGIVLHKKVGDPVTTGDLLASIQGKDEERLHTALDQCNNAFHIDGAKPSAEPLIIKIIGMEGAHHNGSN